MIDEQNYYALNNGGLSQSKLKMYAIDPNYMYRACITGELKRKDAKHFMIGREIDGLLTEIDKSSNTIISPYKDYKSKEAREWRDEMIAIGKTPIKDSEYEEIFGPAIAAQETEVWRDIEKNFTMQEILQIPDNNLGKHFDCLYGKIDAYRINKDGICDVVDLKSALNIEEREFFFKAVKLGYFLQLKFYSMLLKLKYPQIKGFRFWFFVVEKSEPYRTRLYRVDDKLVEECETEIAFLIKEISERTDWNRPNLSWSTAITLKDPRDVDWFDEEDEE